jgi:hypothetical protein
MSFDNSDIWEWCLGERGTDLQKMIMHDNIVWWENI